LLLLLLLFAVAVVVGGLGAVAVGGLGADAAIDWLGLLSTKACPLPLLACLSLNQSRYVSSAHCVSAMQFIPLGHTPCAYPEGHGTAIKQFLVTSPQSYPQYRFVGSSPLTGGNDNFVGSGVGFGVGMPLFTAQQGVSAIHFIPEGQTPMASP